jgi:hypothetical protein
MNSKKCVDSLHILWFVLKNDHNFKSCTKKMFSILFSLSSIISYNFFLLYIMCIIPHLFVIKNSWIFYFIKKFKYIFDFLVKLIHVHHFKSFTIKRILLYKSFWSPFQNWSFLAQQLFTFKSFLLKPISKIG